MGKRWSGSKESEREVSEVWRGEVWDLRGEEVRRSIASEERGSRGNKGVRVRGG